MLCIGRGLVDWSAVSALATVAASFVALFASWLAIRAPKWASEQEQRSGTQEILRATDDAFEIYRSVTELIESRRWPDSDVLPLRIRSKHLYATLDRLIARPSLTDGAIAVGAGAMSILSGLAHLPTSTETLEAAKKDRSAAMTWMYTDTIGPVQQITGPLDKIVKVVEERATKVRHYFARNWLERFKSRFRPRDRFTI